MSRTDSTRNFDRAPKLPHSHGRQTRQLRNALTMRDDSLAGFESMRNRRTR